ncbi:thiol:disulfide interchange protein [Mergibacter septicus]|uniref:thiol:disulfide interchange protein DsbA n=1 Tax=Mergibacter septicus TaxID=221402 RepID=UPI0011792CE4|nr:DsbA family protein [Mergibacter septicus]AWX14296.1 thiol:disulfide interchange protein [Mergibacter septicus]
MKKLLLILFTLFFSVNLAQANATTFSEGKDYFVLNQPQSPQKEVIEFFSFYCPHCYDFETLYKIPQKIRAALPEGASFKQYQVSFIGPEGEDLTRAWAVAMALGVEDKVRDALFEGAHKNVFTSMNDIRQVFIQQGVSAKDFDSAVNSFAVNGLIKKQQNLLKKYNVRGVPDVYVNGRYAVNIESFVGLSTEEFVTRYVDLVLYLLNK